MGNSCELKWFAQQYFIYSYLFVLIRVSGEITSLNPDDAKESLSEWDGFTISLSTQRALMTLSKYNITKA